MTREKESIAIRFGELRQSMYIINPIRRKIGDAVFEAGAKLTLVGRSSEKDSKGRQYIVIVGQSDPNEEGGVRTQYVSEDDTAIDSSMLTKVERFSLDAEQLRQRLKETLFKGNGHNKSK
jgi:hypothetical protein